MNKDLITRSLHRLLRGIRTEYDTFTCSNTMKKLGCESSTGFYVIRDKKVITLSIDIAPKFQTIYFTAIPWFESIHKTKKRLNSYEKRWNTLVMYSFLNIYSESICKGKYNVRIHLRSLALSDANGLTRQLWLRYIDLITNETLRAWTEIVELEKTNINQSLDRNNKNNNIEGPLQNFFLN